MDCDFYAVDVHEGSPKSLVAFVSTRPFVSFYKFRGGYVCIMLSVPFSFGHRLELDVY